MARRPAALVTGAGGEMGHALVRRLAEIGDVEVVALDVRRTFWRRDSGRRARWRADETRRTRS
jgi:NAD(P)-dependent dehydrogenase (short-subunit alcohol dehydrogenase family)